MSAKKSSQDHREYRIRGAATNRKRRKVEAKSGPKSKSGYKLTAPWVCPNPELHGGMNEAS